MDSDDFIKLGAVLLVVVLVIIGLFFGGCNPRTYDRKAVGLTSDLVTVSYDGCEYVLYRPSGEGAGAICHKATCKNPLHR